MHAVSAARRERGTKQLGERSAYDPRVPVVSPISEVVALPEQACEWTILQQLAREFHRGVLTVWILDALFDAPPTSVYELVEHLRVRAGRDYPVWPSPVYRTLGRLRSRGLVEVLARRGPGGSLRRYYQLTEAGRETYPVIRSLATRSWGSMPPSLARVSADPPAATFSVAEDSSGSWGAPTDSPALPPKNRFIEGP